MWRINAGINDWNDIAHAKDKKDPKDVKKIVSVPETFLPDPYNQAAELDENPYANPQDINEFFFKLEAFADQPSPVPSIHLDDFTWLDAGCNLWVYFRALEGFVDNCGIQEYETGTASCYCGNGLIIRMLMQKAITTLLLLQTMTTKPIWV